MGDFENIDYKLTRQQLKQRIKAAIKKAEKLSGGYYSVICQRFLNCVEPEKVPGDNPLPLIANSCNRCHARSKYECLLYMISRILQRFHKLDSLSKLEQLVLKTQIAYFEDVLDKGLGNYKIMGAKYPGYYLVEKE